MWVPFVINSRSVLILPIFSLSSGLYPAWAKSTPPFVFSSLNDITDDVKSAVFAAEVYSAAAFEYSHEYSHASLLSCGAKEKHENKRSSP
jgi:hypothetical protein